MREEDFWSKLSYSLRLYRESAELTQRDVASKIGVSESAYRSYELGDRKIPVDLLVKLAAVYRVSVDVLIGNSEPANEPTIVSGSFTQDQSEKIIKYAELVKNGML
jgi:transcriptional regulator with XRE-family HTH domain